MVDEELTSSLKSKGAKFIKGITESRKELVKNNKTIYYAIKKIHELAIEKKQLIAHLQSMPDIPKEIHYLIQTPHLKLHLQDGSLVSYTDGIDTESSQYKFLKQLENIDATINDQVLMMHYIIGDLDGLKKYNMLMDDYTYGYDHEGYVGFATEYQSSIVKQITHQAPIQDYRLHKEEFDLLFGIEQNLISEKAETIDEEKVLWMKQKIESLVESTPAIQESNLAKAALKNVNKMLNTRIYALEFKKVMPKLDEYLSRCVSTESEKYKTMHAFKQKYKAFIKNLENAKNNENAKAIIVDFAENIKAAKDRISALDFSKVGGFFEKLEEPALGVLAKIEEVSSAALVKNAKIAKKDVKTSTYSI